MPIVKKARITLKIEKSIIITRFETFRLFIRLVMILIKEKKINITSFEMVNRNMSFVD
jgi:hypothetical protein